MKKIFLSSTWAFLESYRAKVRESLERLRHVGFELDWYGMEAFPASSSETSAEASLRYVRSNDIFVGILARRYGTIAPGQATSIVELEYDEAIRLSMPRLLFLLAEDSRVWAEIGPEAEPSRARALSRLRNRFLSDRLLDHFDAPGDLAMKVATALLPDLVGERAAELSRQIDAVTPPLEEGRASSIVLTASPALIPADGRTLANVTAQVTDSAGQSVPNGELLLWNLSGNAVADRGHSLTEDGASSISVRPERSQQGGRLVITCIALRSGVSSSISVDYHAVVDLSAPLEIPTFAVTLVAVQRRAESFAPEFRVKQFSGFPVPELWLRIRGPRFRGFEWRAVTGDALARTPIGGPVDVRAIAEQDPRIEPDEMGLELKFAWAEGWGHELHRFPVTRREHRAKVLWDVGEERLPPLRWRVDAMADD